MAASDEDPFDQTAAAREYRRQARASDRAEAARYRETYDMGRADAAATATPSTAPARSRKSSAGATAGVAAAVDRPRGSLGISAGDVVLGAVGYAVVNAWLLGGLPMVRQWFAAKFLNRTPSSSTSSPATSSAAPQRAAGQTSGR